MVKKSNIVKLVVRGHDNIADIHTMIDRGFISCYDAVKVVEYAYGLEGGDDDWTHPHMHVVLRLDTLLDGDPVALREVFELDRRPYIQDVRLGDSFRAAAEYACKGGEYVWPSRRIYPPYDVNFPTWNPLQQRILDLLEKQGNRKVLCVVDKDGCSGKTFLAIWHVVRFKASYIPFLNDYKDVMRSVCDNSLAGRNVSTVFVDVPRALKQDHLNSLYGSLESLKDGYAWDERYAWREARFPSPKICIFTNTEPDLDNLSPDRWQIIEVDRKLFKEYSYNEYRSILLNRQRVRRSYQKQKGSPSNQTV